MELFRAASARQLSRVRFRGTPLARKGWVCSGCYARRNVVSPRWTSSGASPDSKPYYLTTPIFYVNAAPHVGHMYTMVLTDVLKRWQTLLGRKALLCTGTDEHGMKVQRAAALEEVPPKEFCDVYAATFKDLAAKSNIDNDFFIRTTDPEHREAVEHFWHLLRRNDYIYESTHKGWYCVSDECFYPESMIEKRQDPMTGVVHMASVETGNMVEWTEEKNYHFRMTALKDRLLAFYKENPEWVIPATRMNEVVSWVENNLEDLSISRPTERLGWGIRVPDDATQTIYVWVDALINYLTKAGFPNWTPGREFEGGWPADVHVIGKDIVRFHCVYWPALLLALDLPLPKRVLSHAHWTMGGKKMSKSIGNVVNPFFAIDRWGIDPMRFFLIHDGGIAYDGDYSNASIVDKYKKHLQNGLGNLTSRMMRPKVWNVRAAVESVSAVSDREGILARNEVHKAQIELLRGAPAAVAEQMEKLNPPGALRKIMEVIHETNKYVQKTAPWDLAKKINQESPNGVVEEVKQELDTSLYLTVEALRLSGIFLQAFIPDKAAEMLDIIGVDESKRAFSDAVVGFDFTYGTPKRSPGKGKFDGLFSPLPVED